MRLIAISALQLIAVLLVPCAATAGSQSHPYEILDQLSHVLARIDEEYVEPKDRDSLVEGALTGMVATLDPHSSYLAPDDYQQFKEETSGQFAGIGVEVDLRDGQVIVIAPIPGSPAERAGIRSGDRVVAVNGIPPDTWPLQEITKRIRGKRGSLVSLTVKRASHPEPILFRMVRDDVRLPSVYARLMDNAIGYVRIVAFQDGTHQELLEQLSRTCPNKSCHGLLLDLRQNPGGLVAESVAVADEFLPSGVLFTARHKGELVECVETTGYGRYESLPMVVLVDRGTASAAEILSGALHDHRRATIVGERTFGKGSVQTISDLPNGAGLRLTTLRYYTPAGVGIQAEGVIPNVAASDGDGGEMREFDLPNHLPAETQKAPLSVTLTQPEAPCTPSKPARSILDRIRSLPNSPTDADSPILAKGFRALVAKVTAQSS